MCVEATPKLVLQLMDVKGPVAIFGVGFALRGIFFFVRMWFGGWGMVLQ